MIREESGCVGCQLPCLGKNCPYHTVKIHYCEICQRKANYKIDGEDLCSFHLEEQLNDWFKSLSIREKIEVLEVLNVDCQKYN